MSQRGKPCLAGMLGSLLLRFLPGFLLCQTALWFSGTLLSAPDRLLPIVFLQVIAGHHLLVLLVPAACLAICYGALQSSTRKIMAVPEHFLGKRQKMPGDQAHRLAFKIMKFAGLLIPRGFLLPHGSISPRQILQL